MTYATFASLPHLIVIYLVYGASFVVLGVGALLQPVDDELPMSRRLWLLGVFGVLHGCSEWLEAWMIGAQSTGAALRWASALLAVASFLPLFELARRAAGDWATARGPAWRWLCSTRIYVPILLIVLAATAFSTDRAAALAAVVRYLLAFPGALGAGLALAAGLGLRVGRRTDRILARILGGALIAYGVLAGLITGSVADWQDWQPTVAEFAEFTGLPIQTFRALCAFTAMVTLMWLVRRQADTILRRQQKSANNLKELNRQLEQEVEERTRRLTKSMAEVQRIAKVGSWEIDIATRKVTFDAIGAEIYGIDPRTYDGDYETFIGQAHPEDRQRISEIDRRSMEEGVESAQSYRIIRGDGDIRHLSECSAPQYDTNGRQIAVRGTLQDVTEQRRAEMALRASETLLEMGQRLANMGSYEWNMAGGRWVWSREMWRIHGLEPRDAAPVDDAYLQLVHPDDRQKFLDMETRLKTTGEPCAYDYRITRGDGEERIFHEIGFAMLDERGRAVRAFGVTQDVTEQRRNDAALHERENLLRQGARVGRFGTWLWDVKEDRCLVCSEEMAALYDMSIEEFMREMGSVRQFSAAAPAEDRPAFEEMRRQDVNYTYDVEYRATTKSGVLRYFHEVGQNFLDRATGKILCVGMTQDITESKNTEAELRRLVEESARLAQLAEQSNRAKSEFLATMSHELRTPLNAIIGFSEMLLTYGARISSEQTQDYHETILQSGRHLLSLINDILDLARVESGKLDLDFEPIALPGLVAECVGYLTPTAQREGIGFQIDVPELEIASDRRLLKQLLINLLSNAVKFNRENGTISIAARRDGATIFISITDTGIGMDDDEIVRAMEPFVQLESSHRRTREGTGLGLALVQRFTTLLGGNLKIRSAREVGTTVTIELPVDGKAWP